MCGHETKDVLSTFPSSWKNVTGIAIIFRTVSIYGFWLAHAKSAIIRRNTYKVLTFDSSVYRDRSHRIVALTHFLIECKLVFYHCFQLACNPSCANYIVLELREKLINKMRLYRTRGWVQITKKKGGVDKRFALCKFSLHWPRIFAVGNRLRQKLTRESRTRVAFMRIGNEVSNTDPNSLCISIDVAIENKKSNSIDFKCR